MNIIENLTPKSKEESKGGLSEEHSFEVTSAHAGNEPVDWDGPVETEEMAQGPQVEETEEGTVVELAKFQDDKEATQFEEDTFDISLAEIRSHPSFFTEEEREELSKAEHHISDEDKESIDRVEEALNDPEYPNDRHELWAELCKQEGAYGWEDWDENKNLSEAEKDKKTVEALERQGYDVSPEHPENKEISNMTGSEFQKVMQSAMTDSEPETEELEKNPEEEIEIEETEINTIDEELAEPATQAWADFGGVWAEFSEDLEKETELPDTRIESLGDGFTQITTQYDELQVELMQLHNRDDKDTQVLDMRDDGTMVARAYQGDI